MMTTRQFIDQIASGEAASAKETLDNLLSGRAFEALDAYKKEISAGIFGDNQESQEETEIQDAE